MDWVNRATPYFYYPILTKMLVCLIAGSCLHVTDMDKSKHCSFIMIPLCFLVVFFLSYGVLMFFFLLNMWMNTKEMVLKCDIMKDCKVES